MHPALAAQLLKVWALIFATVKRNVGVYLNLCILAALFAVAVLLFLRPPARLNGVFASVIALGVLLLLLLLSGPERAQGSLVSAATLLGFALYSAISRSPMPTRQFSYNPGKNNPSKKSSPKAATPHKANVPQKATLPSFGLQLPQRKPKATSKAISKASNSTNATQTGLSMTGGANLELQDYEVLDRVGIGGMGSVYRAKRRSDGKTVALKVPQEKYLADAKFVKRFYREAEVLKRFTHPNIVQVYDYRSEGNEYYIAMEFLEGQSLESALEERPLNFEEAVQVLRALSDALRHIHAQNVVHRDIKPGNVMVLRGAFEGGQLREGGVKLMDFGIAVGKVLTRLTMTGARVGTPIYMAPEQAKGNRVDGRSDVYSLGLLAYEMVTGTTAFRGSYEAVVHQQIFESPRPPRQVRMEIPGKLSDLILHMIEKDPALRPTLDEVIARIDAGVLSDEAFSDPYALLVSVQEKQGSLRLLDLHGKLRLSLKNVGGKGGMNTVASAACSDAQGNIYYSLQGSRSMQGTPMLYKATPEGETLLSFGLHGMGEGELLQPAALSVSGERLYVLDSDSHYVTAYSLEGEYLLRFGGRGMGQGRFNKPRMLASTSEHILVLDSGNHEIQRFDLEGRYLSRYAFRLDKTSDELRPLTGLGVGLKGTVYMVDAQAGKVRSVAPGDVVGPTFALESLIGEAPDAPWLLAAGPDGQVYAARQGGHTLRIYSQAGDLLATQDLYAPLQALALVQRPLVT